MEIRTTLLLLILALAGIAGNGDADDDLWFSTDCTADVTAGYFEFADKTEATDDP